MPHAARQAAKGELQLSVRRATLADRSAIERILAASTLPPDGLADRIDHFWVAEAADTLVATTGLEVCPKASASRSGSAAPVPIPPS